MQNLMTQDLPTRRHTRHRCFRALLSAVPVLLTIALVGGCVKAPTSTPAPAFRGPAYLEGTVGSMCTLDGYDPLLVSGIGLVVNLKGTGSSDVPRSGGLRARLLKKLAAEGFGNARYGMQNLSPAQALRDNRTAVVAVEGVIPPGATKDTRFDVVVTALPGTQTTSLEEGTLYTVDMSVDGIYATGSFARTEADARGSIYLNPFEIGDPTVERFDRREGLILSGGRVARDRPLRLVLNQASWTRARRIADRINDRFERSSGDRNETAVARSDFIVEIHVPERFNERTEEFLMLVNYLYVQRSQNFEVVQAERLIDKLRIAPGEARPITLAWVSLGKPVVPVIRKLYEDPNPQIAMTALEAAVRLQDHRAAHALRPLATHTDPTLRSRAAGALAHLTNNPVAEATLRDLLDDKDRQVRIAAYLALADMHHPLVNRLQFGEGLEFKFVLDIVPASRPLVYITQSRLPRVVVFNPMLTFKLPIVANIWDSRLVMKGSSIETMMDVRFRDFGKMAGVVRSIPGTVSHFIWLMGREPTYEEDPTSGFDLSYSNVVNAVYTLHRQGHIPSEIEFDDLALNMQIAVLRKEAVDGIRPEFSEQTEEDERYYLSGEGLPQSVSADSLSDDELEADTDADSDGDEFVPSLTPVLPDRGRPSSSEGDRENDDRNNDERDNARPAPDTSDPDMTRPIARATRDERASSERDDSTTMGTLLRDGPE